MIARPLLAGASTLLVQGAAFRRLGALPAGLNILDGGTSVLLLAGYVAAFVLGTVWLVRRRDVN
ncbi:hypothetical protein [Rhodococcus wratislaviensis]|uniref:hypothetical protein n=1 Tax=Rhodococcus wratislaviensis TaxID=44752 RepID=UPI003510E435